MSDVSFILINPKSSRRQSTNEPSISLIDAWQASFVQHLTPADRERFVFVESTLDQLDTTQYQFDCIVSPANSYGIMDGGFDYYLSVALSPSKDIMALTRLVQSAIKSRYYGFMPPGSCLLVPGLPPNRFGCKIIAVCPTMRLPTELKWHKDIVYNTMWSLLVEIERWNEAARDHNKIKKVLMTGLGTGVGKIPPEVCARQMALAVKHFVAAIRSEEGKEKWTQDDYPDWSKVLPMAEEVVAGDVEPRESEAVSRR